MGLNEAVSMATAYELTEKGDEELQGGNDKESVNKVLWKKKSEKREKNGKAKEDNKKCFRCGNAHLADKSKYKDFTCHFCNKNGHFKKMCFKQKMQKNRMNQISEHKTKLVEELFKVEMYGEVHNIGRKIKCKLSVNNLQISFEVDTGSPVSIINLEDVKKTSKNHSWKKQK